MNMRNIMLLMGVATMAFAMPASAQGNGKGKGASAKAQASSPAKASKAGKHTGAHTSTSGSNADVNGNGIFDRYERDSNRDGIADYRQAANRSQVDRNNNGIIDQYESGSRVNYCPPGLAKKTPACIPPGQAKQAYNIGQRLPSGYRYVAVPDRYVGQIGDYDPNRYRYYYDEQRVYVVDPATSLITRIVDLVL
jgi:Ni/Co efflux regulator RcnB